VEPIGTVTNFYPFLSERTVQTIKSSLEIAEGYDDLVSRLVDIVLEQDSTNDLSIFTTIHVWLSTNYEIFMKLLPKIREDDILEVWTFIHFRGTAEEFENLYPLTLKNALKVADQLWVKLHLLMIGSYLGTRGHNRLRYLETAEELIENHPELRCFSPEILMRRGWLLRSEGDNAGAMKNFNDAKDVAERYNDIIRRSDALCDLATSLKESDVYQAIALLEDAYQTFKSLGATSWAGFKAADMGLLHTIIGEYDLALQFYREGERISKLGNVHKRNMAVVVARIYCDIDSPEEALEWTKYYMEWDNVTPSVLKQLPTLGNHYIALSVAKILVLLGQLEKASQILNETHKIILEQGDDRFLILYNHTVGLLEVAQGNLDGGFQCMIEAHGEAKRLNIQVYVNMNLLSLAKTELKYYKELGSGGIESSGPWMNELGVHARENNYPGIMMQHALLKAEYQEMIGETEAAKLTLKDALSFTDSLGVRTLRQRILDKLNELETSVDA
jgi:tetratricopeptide (TPR) repeat protein